MQKMHCMGKNHTHFWARTTLMPTKSSSVGVQEPARKVGAAAFALSLRTKIPEEQRQLMEKKTKYIIGNGNDIA